MTRAYGLELRHPDDWHLPPQGGELPLNFHPDWFFADALAALAGHASAASVGRGCRR